MAFIKIEMDDINRQVRLEVKGFNALETAKLLLSATQQALAAIKIEESKIVKPSSRLTQAMKH